MAAPRDRPQIPTISFVSARKSENSALLRSFLIATCLALLVTLGMSFSTAHLDSRDSGIAASATVTTTSVDLSDHEAALTESFIGIGCALLVICCVLGFAIVLLRGTARRSENSFRGAIGRDTTAMLRPWHFVALPPSLAELSISRT